MQVRTSSRTLTAAFMPCALCTPKGYAIFKHTMTTQRNEDAWAAQPMCIECNGNIKCVPACNSEYNDPAVASSAGGNSFSQHDWFPTVRKLC